MHLFDTLQNESTCNLRTSNDSNERIRANYKIMINLFSPILVSEIRKG